MNEYVKVITSAGIVQTTYWRCGGVITTIILRLSGRKEVFAVLSEVDKKFEDAPSIFFATPNTIIAKAGIG